MNRNPDTEVRRVASLPADTEHSLPRGSKTIIVHFEQENYSTLVENAKMFRLHVDACYKEHPELFPEGMKNGYYLHGFTIPSVKQDGLRLRRIKLIEGGEVFSICPSFVMPYMTGLTDDIEKALFLRKFEVPYWALTYVFGHDDMYWERIENSIGRNSITGTTVRCSTVPGNLIADEKKSRLDGSEINIAVTAGKECILGAAVCTERTADALEEGYGVFKEEVRNVNPEYTPETVTTDGSDALRNAWKSLFPSVILILCFLHSVLNIKKRCSRMGDLFTSIMEKVWSVYHADTKASFMQRLRRFREWAVKTGSPGIVLKKILALCEKGEEFKKSYDYPNAPRTSNMIDRIMNRQDRYLYNIQYYHGTFISAELNVRAWAILYNFYPYSPRACPKDKDWICAAERLNGFRYSDNWLENLLIASSMNGYRQ